MHRARWSIRTASAGPAGRRRSPSDSTGRGRRHGASQPLRPAGGARSFGGLRADDREVCVDIVPAWMPEAKVARRIKPIGDGAGGGGILVHQEIAHLRIAEVGIM